MARFTNQDNPGKGRPKGSKNKAKVMRAEEVMALAKFNPTAEMIRQILDESTPLDIKAKLAIELNALLNPKAKAVEPSKEAEPEIEGDDSATILQLLKTSLDETND